MCNICCEDWSAKVVKTECPYCKYATCQSCMKTYMLDSLNDPKCMHSDCKKVWTIDHLFTIVPASFITNKYKKHRESVLYNREMAMLPATQPYFERTMLQGKMAEELSDIEKRIRQLKMDRIRIKNTLRDLNHMPIDGVDGAGTSAGPSAVPKERQQYAGRCGNGECKGFVCNSAYKCGVCDAKYCNKCFGIKGDDQEHTCNPDDVKTYEAVRLDSKPCPSCATLVFKVSGCSMMFCTQCNTAWDWNTLKITRNENQIHNPHYFEWRAANPGIGARLGAGNQLLELNCANELTTRHIDAVCMSMPSLKDRNNIMEIWGAIMHVHHEEMHKYPIENAPMFERNVDIRIKYLGNVMDEKHFKSILHMREKAGNKKREIRQILQTFMAVSKEYMLEFCQANPRKVQNLVAQFDKVVVFTDEAFKKVATRYKCVVPQVSVVIEKRKATTRPRYYP